VRKDATVRPTSKSEVLPQRAGAAGGLDVGVAASLSRDADGRVLHLRDLAPSGEQTNGGCPMATADADATDSLYYWDYLQLDGLLNAQAPKSLEAGHVQHDEFLFICVHQTSELWFKQILVELDSVRAIMGGARVAERDLSTVVSRLRRVNEILHLLVGQIDVLETMTPLDFLEFRMFLVPASGFQSVQFRLIENKFGLRVTDRLNIEGHSYASTLREEHAQLVGVTEQSPSLFDQVEGWLARTPFLGTDVFDFVARYRDAADAMHAIERTEIGARPHADTESRNKQLAAFETSVAKFDAVFDPTNWAEDVRQGKRRFSYEAFTAALFITLYRDEPVLQVPFQILTTLLELDESFTIWRQRHALMAHRMLGRQAGSAGSGYTYLDETAKRYKVFNDLFDVSTYLLPRSALPPLPDPLLRQLDARDAQ
jgi:tryptophan 2,3-dioxygenase